MTPIYFGPGDIAWLEPESEEEREFLRMRINWSLEGVWAAWQMVERDEAASGLRG